MQVLNLYALHNINSARDNPNQSLAQQMYWPACRFVNLQIYNPIKLDNGSNINKCIVTALAKLLSHWLQQVQALLPQVMWLSFNDTNQYVVASATFAGANPASGDTITLVAPGLSSRCCNLYYSVGYFRNMAFSCNDVCWQPCLSKGRGRYGYRWMTIQDWCSGLAVWGCNVSRAIKYMRLRSNIGVLKHQTWACRKLIG